MIVKEFRVSRQHLLHVLAHLEKHNVARLDKTTVTID